jgi:hypothetical protein
MIFKRAAKRSPDRGLYISARDALFFAAYVTLPVMADVSKEMGLSFTSIPSCGMEQLINSSPDMIQSQ